jgi:hypothetical protein
MSDAEAVIGRLDARLAELGDPAYHQRVLDAFTDSLNDFRADGDLDAHVERCQRLLEEAAARVPAAPATPFTPERTLLQAWTSVFSSG